MKINIALLNLIAITLILGRPPSIDARSITIAPAPNITRNAGQTIPLKFTAAGFAGQTADILLINARTWAPGEVIATVPVVNGPNSVQVEIPWSWEAVGSHVLKIVAGSTYATDRRVVTIRTAVTWPYFGTVFAQGGPVSVKWVVGGDWDLGEYMDFALHNEDTGETYMLDAFTDEPYSGRFEFYLPRGVTGRFRILLQAIYVWTMPDAQSEIVVVQETQSAAIAIK